MRYFTLDWWNGTQEFTEGTDPSREYCEYFESIRKNLPQSFLELHDEDILHDSQLREIQISTQSSILELQLDCDDGSGGLKQVKLIYSGLIQFNSTADQDNALPGPQGFGDCGYDEVEILMNGILEHRILFSSGIEIVIQCRDLETNYVDSHPAL